MADSYFEDQEVIECGQYFVKEVSRLEHLSDSPINVTQVKELVQCAVQAVEAKRMVASPRGLLRGRDAADGMRQNIQRFFYYLRSLPRNTRFDIETFFPGSRMGDMSKMTPDEISARGDSILQGFETAESSDLPNAQEWMTELLENRAALDDAMAGKQQVVVTDPASMRSLTAARQRFRRVYNGVAKRLIRGLLIHLGREREYRRYFLDLQAVECAPKLPPGADDVTTIDDGAPVIVRDR